MDDSTRDKRSQQIVASMLAKQLTWDREKKEMEARVKELEKQKRDAKVKALQYRAQTVQWKKGQRTVDNPSGNLPKISFGKKLDQEREQREARRAEKRRIEALVEESKKARRGDQELPSLVQKRLRQPPPPVIVTPKPVAIISAPEGITAHKFHSK